VNVHEQKQHRVKYNQPNYFFFVDDFNLTQIFLKNSTQTLVSPCENKIIFEVKQIKIVIERGIWIVKKNMINKRKISIEHICMES